MAGSVTGPYLSGKKAIPVPSNRRMPSLLLPRAQSNGEAAAPKKRAPRRPLPPSKPNPVFTAPAKWPQAPGGWLEIVGARATIFATSPPAFHWVALPRWPASAAARVRSSRTCCTARSPARCTAPSTAGQHGAIRGLEQVNKVIRVDQQPLGGTPTSSPATYTRSLRPDSSTSTRSFP